MVNPVAKIHVQVVLYSTQASCLSSVRSRIALGGSGEVGKCVKSLNLKDKVLSVLVSGEVRDTKTQQQEAE